MNIDKKEQELDDLKNALLDMYPSVYGGGGSYPTRSQELVYEAAQAYAELLPKVRELKEANDEVEDAYLELQRTSIDEPFSMRHRKADDTLHSARMRFQETAARIASEMEGA